jgi:cholest-4-en-3-one 26-monooxygenase
MVKLHKRLFSHRRQCGFCSGLPFFGGVERHVVDPHWKPDRSRDIGLPIHIFANAMQVEKRNAAAVTSIEKYVPQEMRDTIDDLAADLGVDQREPKRFVKLGCLRDITTGIGNVVKTRHAAGSHTTTTRFNWAAADFRSRRGLVQHPAVVSNPMTADHIDLLDPWLWQRNPHDVWQELRATQPVYHDKRNGLFAILRHADVLMVERRSDLFPSAHAYRAIPAREESNMIAQDDPGHRAQRMLVQRFFAPGPVAQREPAVRAIVTELIDNALERGTIEVINDLAGQLPARLTCQLMGFPEEHWPKLKEWSERLMRTDMHQRDGHTAVEFMIANQELFEMTKQQVDFRRSSVEPPDDLLTVWSSASLNGAPIDMRTIYHEAGLFVSGGAETTRTTVAHGLHALAEHRDQWERLRAHPELVPTAIEEIFRWVTPLNNMFRVSVARTEVSGTTIGPADRVIMVYPSANRDEAVFDDPYRFDIGRTPNHHLSFGNGPHMCVGAPLARLTMRVLFDELVRRVRTFSVVSPPEVEANIFARAVKRFDLQITGA